MTKVTWTVHAYRTTDGRGREERGVVVNRDLASGRLDFVELDPAEMIALATDLLLRARP